MDQSMENLSDILIQVKDLSSKSIEFPDWLKNTTDFTCCKYSECSKDWAQFAGSQDNLLICLQILKTVCTHGPSYQEQICTKPDFFDNVNGALSAPIDDSNDIVQRNTLHLLANICVQNQVTQKKVWSQLEQELLKFYRDDYKLGNIVAMIIHNTYLNCQDLILPIELVVLDTLATHFKDRTDDTNNDFYQILLEHFLIERGDTEWYMTLQDDNRTSILYYMLEFLRDENEKRILNGKLFKQLVDEFKQKSDAILNSRMAALHEMRPELVTTLLEIISVASCKGSYGHILNTDGSLFLNLGCLIKAINAIGRESENVFTPIQKLEHVAPNSTANKAHIHHEFFEFKVNIVKCIANLTYRNKKNQKLIREMDILQEVLNCANVDARNPMIKEWTILVIRNICEDNQENQKFIASLTKMGQAKNSILEEFIEDSGVMRIKPST